MAAPTKKKLVPRDPPVNAPAASSGSRDVDAVVSLVGQKVAELRRAKGLSLQQLAEASDVSSASIHKIERSGMVPTITTLLKLAAALGVTVSYFVEEGESSPDPVHFTPADKRPRVYTSHKGLNLSGISGSYQKFQTAAAVADMAPGATSGEKALRHPGEELVHILSGEVFFRVNGVDYVLRAGDSLQFLGTLPHHWENRSKTAAEILWIAFRSHD